MVTVYTKVQALGPKARARVRTRTGTGLHWTGKTRLDKTAPKENGYNIFIL